jgi:hypothetical protein
VARVERVEVHHSTEAQEVALLAHQ